MLVYNYTILYSVISPFGSSLHSAFSNQPSSPDLVALLFALRSPGPTAVVTVGSPAAAPDFPQQRSTTWPAVVTVGSASVAKDSESSWRP